MIMEEQDQGKFPPFTAPTDTCLLSSPILLESSQDQGATYREHYLHQQQLQQQQGPSELLPVGGSRDHIIDSQINNNCSNDITAVQNLFSDQYNLEDQHAHQSVKWMSSKMRLMRKMMSSDQILVSKPTSKTQALQDQKPPNHDSSSNRNDSPSSIIRVCSNCNTTKTPLWRSGPQGPKSLCNACGIRQMKARRAMAAASALSSGQIPVDAPKKVQKKEKKSDMDRTVPFKKRFPIKKRYKISASGAAQKSLCFNDAMTSLRKSLAFYQAFPQEEKDAAILLMALSCGLIHG